MDTDGLQPELEFVPERGQMAATMMRAVRYDRYGPADVLQEVSVDKPAVAGGEVLVRVHGAPVSGGEDLIRAGRIAFLTGHKFPRGTGNDFAGEVTQIGAGVSGFEIGDRVWGLLPRMTFGAVAEFVAVPAARIAPAPRNLDLVEAAMLPAVGTTIIRALTIEAKLRSGERLLVRGASGGLGVVAVQLGKSMGAHFTGLAGADNLAFVRDLGADEAVDYKRTSPSDLGRFDVVLDVVGTDMGSYRALLARGGRMVGLAFDPQHPVRSLLYLAVSKAFGSRRVRAFSNDPDQFTIKELTALVERGAIRPIVADILPMSRIADAHRALEGRGLRGKQVIDPRMVHDTQRSLPSTPP